MALVAALGFEFFAVVQECFCIVPVEIEGDHLMVSRGKEPTLQVILDAASSGTVLGLSRLR